MSKLNNKDLVQRWHKTGLLDQLSSDKKTKCAIHLQEMADILLKEYGGKTPTKKSQMICGNVLPLVRLLYGEKIKTFPKVSWLYEDYNKFIKNNPSENPLTCGKDEAECIKNYVENLVSRLNSK